jgi:cytochrome oxidase Cu insertion factor (SCO1/SenC/PrrC family)
MMTMGRGRMVRFGVISAVGTLALLAGGVWALRDRVLSTPRGWNEASPSGELPVIGQLPDFSLVDSRGSDVTLADLEGAPWVAGFIFTSCAGICPRMSTEMARVQESLPPDSPVKLVSITVDPVHDTPEVLQGYAARFGARPERWMFLTGEPQEIYRLAGEGFLLAAGELLEFDPEQADGPFVHSSRLCLVDAEGRMRGYYEGTDPTQVDRLLQDLASLN